MSQGRRHFTDEFKREAVALLVSRGRPLSRIASELGISASMRRASSSRNGERHQIGRAISRGFAVASRISWLITGLRFFADEAAKKWPLRGSLRRPAG